MTKPKVIKVSEKNYNTIVKEAGKLQQKTGKPTSLNSIITLLLKKHKGSRHEKE